MSLWSSIKTAATTTYSKVFKKKSEPSYTFTLKGSYGGGYETPTGRTPSGGYVSGGGGVSAPTTTPTPEEIKEIEIEKEKAEAISKPTKAFPDIYVKEYKDPTLGEALTTIKTTVQQEGLGKGIQQAPTLIYKAIRKPTEAERIRKEKEERDIKLAEEEVIISKEEMEKGVKGVGGTAQDIKYQQRPDSVLLRDAKLGDQPSLIAYTQRQERNIELNAEQESMKIRNENLKEYNKESDIIQGKIDRGEITHSAGINIQKDLSIRLQITGQERLDKSIEKDITPRQKIIDDAAKKGKITRGVVMVAVSLAAGVGTGAVLTGATRAGKVVLAGAGVMAGKEAVELGTGVMKGERDIIDVATFGATLTAFVVGAKIGGKIKTSAQQTKLESAIKRSDIKYKTEGISGEAEITRLNIPDSNKVELIARLKGGGSLRKIKADLKPTTTADQKIIQENLPYRKTEFVEVTDRMGNVIDRVAIGKVTVAGKTGKQFTQDVIAESKGRITPEGTVEFETLTAVAPEGKPKALEGEPIKKVTLTREQITGTVRRAGDLRLVRTKTGVKLIETIEAEKGRPLTQRDIERLLLSAETGKPISKGEYIELARTRRIDIKALQADKDIFIVKEETLKTKGVGISRQVLEVPPTVKRKPKTPFEKTFPKDSKIEKIKEDVSKTIDKMVGSADKRLKQIRERIPKAKEQIIGPPVSVEAGTRIAFEEAAKVIPKQKLPVAILTGERMLDINKLLGRQQEDLVLQSKQLQSNILDPTRLDEGIAQLQQQGFKQLQQLRQKQIPTQDVSQALSQIRPEVTVPEVPIPTVVVPPTLPEGRIISPEKLEKSIKKRQKEADDYAASLSAAVLQKKPVEVTPKQFKKLKEKEFLGHEIRPVLKLKLPKRSKKKIKI